MCVILASNNKSWKPSLAILRAAEIANPHGGGIAWRVGKRIRFEKGLGAEEIFEITKHEQGPFLIHFRIASVGAIKPELCHPFPVGGEASIALSGKANSVIAHNGTWVNWHSVITRASKMLDAKMPTGPMSDSRAMAWLVSHVGARAFNGIRFSRFAYFTRNGIKLFGDWHKLDGFSASNLGWRYNVDETLSKRSWKREDARGSECESVSEFRARLARECRKTRMVNGAPYFRDKDGCWYPAKGVAFTKGKSLYDQVQFELGEEGE